MFRCDHCAEMQPPRTKAHRVVTQVRVVPVEYGAPSVQIVREAAHCLPCAVLVCKLRPVRLADMDSVLSHDVRVDLTRHHVNLKRYTDPENEVALLGLPTEQELRETAALAA